MTTPDGQNTTLDGLRLHLMGMILKEAAGLGMLPPELAEKGWTQMGRGSAGIGELDRVAVNEQARFYYHKDPTANHIINLKTDYVFGRGVSLRAEHPDINTVIQRFWNDPRNRLSISSYAAQKELSTESQLNGETFFMLFTNMVSGRVTVRRIDPNEIVEIVPVPGDAAMPYFYKREYWEGQKRVRQAVLDYRIADPRNTFTPQYTTGAPKHVEVAMMHVVNNRLDGRGLSEIATAIPWISALNGFMEDRATLTMLLALFSYIVQVRGNREAVGRVRASMERYEQMAREGAEGRAAGNNERTTAGKFLYMNDSTSIKQAEVDTGASNAYQDMRMFRQMVGLGGGVFEHYLGDAGNANLAVGTAMELPMLKRFQGAQQFHNDVFVELGQYQVRQAARMNDPDLGGLVEAVAEPGMPPLWYLEPAKGVSLDVAAVFPPIVEDDIALYASALQALSGVETSQGIELLPPAQKAQIVLGLFGMSAEANALIREMQGRQFAPTVARPAPVAPEPLPTEAEEVALGKPLPKKQAVATPTITRAELQAAAAEWRDLPPLDEFLKSLNVTAADVED